MNPKNFPRNIVRLAAAVLAGISNRVAPGICAVLFAVLLSALVVGGCATKPRTHGYKWACTGKCDLPLRQASAKCTAQANSAVGTDISYKHSIRDDCLAGEGWEKVRCVLAGDPDCK